MLPRRASIPLLLGAIVALVVLCSTVESQQGDPSKDDQQTVGSKAQKGSPAARLDFQKSVPALLERLRFLSILSGFPAHLL